MVFIPRLESLDTEEIQKLGFKWLQRLPKGAEKRLEMIYLKKPAISRRRLLYGNTALGREGIIQVFLEIIANVLIYEHGEARKFEENKAYKEKRKAIIIEFIHENNIEIEHLETYAPYKIA